MEDLLKTLVGLGPGGVIAAFMFYMWKDERAERRELQTRVLSMVVDSTEAERDMTRALEAMSMKIK